MSYLGPFGTLSFQRQDQMDPSIVGRRKATPACTVGAMGHASMGLGCSRPPKLPVCPTGRLPQSGAHVAFGLLAEGPP